MHSRDRELCGLDSMMLARADMEPPEGRGFLSPPPCFFSVGARSHTPDRRWLQAAETNFITDAQLSLPHFHQKALESMSCARSQIGAAGQILYSALQHNRVKLGDRGRVG